MSLDGFIVGPDDAMDWAFAHGGATSLAGDTTKRIGPVLAGRRWYDLALERWDGPDGIYGGAFSGTVFVLTHRPADVVRTRGSGSSRMGLRRRWRAPSAPLATAIELERVALGEAEQLTDSRFRVLRCRRLGTGDEGST